MHEMKLNGLLTCGLEGEGAYCFSFSWTEKAIIKLANASSRNICWE